MPKFEQQQSQPEKAKEGQFISFPKTREELIAQIKKTTSDSLANAETLISQMGLQQNPEAIQALNEFRSTTEQAATETGIENPSQNPERQKILDEAQKLVQESEQLRDRPVMVKYDTDVEFENDGSSAREKLQELIDSGQISAKKVVEMTQEATTGIQAGHAEKASKETEQLEEMKTALEKHNLKVGTEFHVTKGASLDHGKYSVSSINIATGNVSIDKLDKWGDTEVSYSFNPEEAASFVDLMNRTEEGQEKPKPVAKKTISTETSPTQPEESPSLRNELLSANRLADIFRAVEKSGGIQRGEVTMSPESIINLSLMFSRGDLPAEKVPEEDGLREALVKLKAKQTKDKAIKKAESNVTNKAPESEVNVASEIQRVTSFDALLTSVEKQGLEIQGSQQKFTPEALTDIIKKSVAENGLYLWQPAVTA
ncbi:hypothetical protein HN858_04995 [Candidatus Falkowbacteria bacterium]|jgi:hypothetical protein|nr:hypothetical protein [Candidatus Falkowbacteria bacterium]MBT6574526.1 hypothetical protein [Candidatus Falkowbacteria bacterium]MBT7348996.1 hypothetical protein [Candidatus Falkowbacteria bacterium]MBT7500569.1 hypothetical protein [Candidatus Falkowbacteria bacterium]